MSAAAAPAPAYTVHAGDPLRDRELVLAIWRGNIGREERHAAKYAWFYEGCPYGAPLLRLLRHEASGEWVGVAAAGPRRMRIGDRELRAGVLVDLAVDAKHRSLGPALMLQRAVLASAPERFDLVYGFPNPKAAPVFAHVGYRRLGDGVRHVRVLRYRDYLARRLPRWAAAPAALLVEAGQGIRRGWHRLAGGRPHARWLEGADPRLDAALADPARASGPAAVRNAAFWRWRFDAAPGDGFRYLVVERRGAPLAWFACQPDGAVLYVRDFVVRPGPGAIGRACIAALCHAARRAGHASISVEYGGPAAGFHEWIAAGFVERSRRPVYGKCLDPALGSEADLALYLTAADEDE